MNTYTDWEHDRLIDLMDELPSEFYGAKSDRDWENIILEMAEIVQASRRRSQDKDKEPAQ